MQNKKFFPLIIIALLLRVIFAIYRPLDLDEVFAFYVGQKSFAQILQEVKYDAHPPLHYFLHKIFDISKSEIGIRFIFLISGLLSIIFLFKLHKSWYSLLICCFSAYLWEWGIEARMYPLVILFSSALIYFFIKTFEENNFRNFIFFVIFSVLSLYNFYLSSVLLIVLFFLYLIFKRKSRSPFKFYILSYLFVFILILPLFFLFKEQLSHRKEVASFHLSTGAVIPYFIHVFCFGEYLIKVKGISDAKCFAKAFPLLILFLLNVFILYRGFKKNWKGKFMGYCLLLSLIFTFLLSFKLYRVMHHPKYLLWLYPVFFYLFCEGLSQFKGNHRNILVAFIIFLNLISIYKRWIYPEEDWRKFAHFMEEKAKEKDILLFDAGYMRMPFDFYYRGRCRRIGLSSENPEEFYQKIKDELKNYNRIWLILSHNWKTKHKYFEILRKDFKLLGKYEFPCIEVFLFSVDKSPG